MVRLVFMVASVCVVWFQQNHQPVVKITSPRQSEKFVWNQQLRYAISVTDREDGDTRFDEIPGSEILLEAKVAKDTTDVGSSHDDRAAIHAMLKSNCMNCHAFNSTLIGPSFYEISSKYSDGDAGELIKRIKEGSSGKWGSTVMPTHPELSVDEIARMVKWILDHGDSEEVSYFLGKEGSIRLRKQPSDEQTVLVLTASYHDRNDSEGVDKVTLKLK